MRTILTIFWGVHCVFPDQTQLVARLYLAHGRLACERSMSFERGLPVFLDSERPGPWEEFAGTDGVLALDLCTLAEPSTTARQSFRRLYPLVDWVAADGRVCSLHIDQVVCGDRDTQQRFTEIVVIENDCEHTPLIVLHGERQQSAGALRLGIKNSEGYMLEASYPIPMEPVSLHRLVLAELAPGLIRFAAGKPLLISGSFDSLGLYTRPYVETTGSRWVAYHGGDTLN
jgi:hypothetical protein